MQLCHLVLSQSTVTLVTFTCRQIHIHTDEWTTYRIFYTVSFLFFVGLKWKVLPHNDIKLFFSLLIIKEEEKMPKAIN